jgi:hypothetical protein
VAGEDFGAGEYIVAGEDFGAGEDVGAGEGVFGSMPNTDIGHCRRNKVKKIRDAW